MTPSPRSRKSSAVGESPSPSQILFTHEEIVVLKLLFSLFDRGGKVIQRVQAYVTQILLTHPAAHWRMLLYHLVKRRCVRDCRCVLLRTSVDWCTLVRWTTWISEMRTVAHRERSIERRRQTDKTYTRDGAPWDGCF